MDMQGRWRTRGGDFYSGWVQAEREPKLEFDVLLSDSLSLSDSFELRHSSGVCDGAACQDASVGRDLGDRWSTCLYVCDA